MEQAIVKQVDKGSIAEEAGIEKGDIICSINGIKLKDILSYKFLTSDLEFSIIYKKPDGEEIEVAIFNDEYEDLGITFYNPLISIAKACQNKCIFCFIDQLPKGMRNPLYFKDDDTRLSFLQGNYVTLTNLSDEEIDSIIKMRISPINVSVHTTNPQLREFMLGNKKASKLNVILQKFHQNNIALNCQIVLCKGVNDGEELIKTLIDLSEIYPTIKSVSVVPVGISNHREGLFKLEPFNIGDAKSIISVITDIQKDFYKRLGSKIVYLADEFYLLADVLIPDYSHYDDFPQIENGVGLLASFKQEFYDALSDDYAETNRTVSIATGVISYDFICSLADELKKRVKGLIINVFSIKNTVFGDKITVTGLVCGKDIISQLKGKNLGDVLLIPSAMLRGDDGIFLDDVYISDIKRELNVDVKQTQINGYNFINDIIGGTNE